MTHHRLGFAARLPILIIVAFAITIWAAVFGLQLAMEDPDYFDDINLMPAERFRVASGLPPRVDRPLRRTERTGTLIRIASPDINAVERDARLLARRGPGAFVPTSTLLERTLPSAAFALEAGQSLDPRLPPGPFEAAVEVTFRPVGDPMGKIGATLVGLGLVVERNGTGLHADAAGTAPRNALTSSPVWMSAGLERITWTVRRTNDRPVAFRAERMPQSTGKRRAIPSSGASVVGVPTDAFAADTWPPAAPTWPVDALIHALDVGRCTACHAFHARLPVATPPAPDLAAASATRTLPELILGLEPCVERGRSAGYAVPEFGPDDADTIARLLMQSAGRLPSLESD